MAAHDSASVTVGLLVKEFTAICTISVAPGTVVAATPPTCQLSLLFQLYTPPVRLVPTQS